MAHKLQLLAAVAALALSASAAQADEFKITESTPYCATAVETENSCVRQAPGRVPVTIAEFAEAVQFDIVNVERLIRINGWEGATGDTVIPTYVDFRLI